MTNLYDALELCLQEIENGAEIESVLVQYPDLADELRPILETSVQARSLSAPEPSDALTRRNRAKVLQRAAEMSDANIKPAPRSAWFASARRFATSLALLILIFASGTNLVSASTISLPGDNLYSVKRSWENLQLFFAFDGKLRKALEVKNENERIHELRELIASGRSAEVTFNGLLTRQTATGWLIAKTSIVITPETDLPSQPLAVNSAVRVRGQTQSDGSVLVLSIDFLPPDASLPSSDNDDAETANEDELDTESEDDAPNAVATQTSDANEVVIAGSLHILDDDFWMINGVPADVSDVEVEGDSMAGAQVIVEGFFNKDGVFIVTKIKFLESQSDDGNDSNSNQNDDSDDDQNDNDDDDNDNDDDDNDND